MKKHNIFSQDYQNINQNVPRHLSAGFTYYDQQVLHAGG